MHSRYGSVAAYRVALAAVAGARVRLAQQLVAVALALLLAGIVVTWWAPAEEPKEKPVYIKVSHTGGSACGTLNSADGGRIRLKSPGRHEPVVVPLTAVTNLKVVKSCG